MMQLNNLSVQKDDFNLFLEKKNGISCDIQAELQIKIFPFYYI